MRTDDGDYPGHNASHDPVNRCWELTSSMVMPEITGKVEDGRIDDLQWDMVFRSSRSAKWPVQDTKKLTWKDQGPFLLGS